MLNFTDMKYSMNHQTLFISEIFKSLQGESTAAGRPCVFIRLAGCNLRCGYCDTKYAWTGGQPMTIKQIMDRVNKYRTKLVEITGGEPLLQPVVIKLMKKLHHLGHEVLLETNGSLDIKSAQPYARIILDIKSPGSGRDRKILWSNLKHLRQNDEVKFVLTDRPDYLWSKKIVKKYALNRRCVVLLSPVQPKLPARKLANWIIKDNLPIRLNLQFHKYIFGARARGK